MIVLPRSHHDVSIHDNRMIRNHLISVRACAGYREIARRRLGSKAPKKGSHARRKKSKNPKVPGSTDEFKQEAKVPPTYLSPTGSPHAFVAKCAADEFGIDPSSLFDDQTESETLRKATFEYISPKLFGHKVPEFRIPEVAFLGRSNVGKSSLINALMRKDLARSSKRPGRTQTVHYFGLMPTAKQSSRKPSSALGFLIDLPGFGFAKAPDSAVSRWQEVTQDFLLARRDLGTLRRTFLLIDARRGTSQFDRNIMGWFDEAEMEYSVVLTKSDKVSTAQLVRFSNDACMRYHSQMYTGTGSQGPIIHVTSASRKSGIEELMASVDAEFASYFTSQSTGHGGEYGEDSADLLDPAAQVFGEKEECIVEQDQSEDLLKS